MICAAIGGSAPGGFLLLICILGARGQLFLFEVYGLVPWVVVDLAYQPVPCAFADHQDELSGNFLRTIGLLELFKWNPCLFGDMCNISPRHP